MLLCFCALDVGAINVSSSIIYFMCLLRLFAVNWGSLFVDYLLHFRHVVVLCRLYGHFYIKSKILQPAINSIESTKINQSHREFPKSHREFPRGERRFSLIYLQRGGDIPYLFPLSLETLVFQCFFLYLPLCISYRVLL